MRYETTKHNMNHSIFAFGKRDNIILNFSFHVSILQWNCTLIFIYMITVEP